MEKGVMMDSETEIGTENFVEGELGMAGRG